jgi:hypothetical protein
MLDGRVLALDLNAPGQYLHWGVLTISLANLLVVVVMLLVFLAAMLLPFPGRDDPPVESAGSEPRPGEPVEEPRTGSWTGGLRRVGLRWLPPGRLLPETQPSYVASWVYVFGVATLAALAVAVGSGVLITLGGPDWWHTTVAGHFFNSMHLWSVELFMAFMVVHLWGKFFMAAWRGRRARTWITGMIAFLVSIIEAFTGYLSQQNFDSQWIATNGKDAFNAIGIGPFFRVMNFGQMLLWHVLLVPLVLLTLVAVHVLLVRYRGVVHPFPARRGRDALGRRVDGSTSLSRGEMKAADAAEWAGPKRRYDIVKEAVAATAVVGALVVAVAGILSSPDVRAITIQKWAKAAPADFVGTAAAELAGTSDSAQYGPPYNHGTAGVQTLGPHWQTLVGVRTPVDPARAFVLDPLHTLTPGDPTLASALSTWNSASATRRDTWAGSYADAAANATVSGGTVQVKPGDYGPVPTLMRSELALGRSGALDTDLVAHHEFYGTDYTKPLLFLADGGYYADRASAEHLQGDQWGVLNETGSYPGQPWLWLFQLWYHVPGLRDSPNVDLIALYLTGFATVLLVLIPFIPGLRAIPRKVPLHRLIWRSYYREAEHDTATPNGPAEP